MQYTTLLLASTTLISSVHAHGMITSPTPRAAGTAMQSTCGTQVYNNQASDSFGNIQGELQVASSETDYSESACEIWLCKGYKFADNSDNVQSWSLGQTVDFTFDVRAPHTGYANVSIVDTTTNSIVGDMLLVYDDFADNAKTIPANETSFSITIPSNLDGKCETAGECVVQHFWNAESIDQTYESCVDFTVGGSSGSSSGSSSAVASSSSTFKAAASSSAVKVSSTAAAVVTSSSISSVPATLQTQTKASSTPVSKATSVLSAPAAQETADDDDEDDCE